MSAAAARDEIVLAFDVLKAPDATLSVAMNRRIVACNDAAEGLLGYRAEELIGALFCDIVGRCYANGQDACRRRCAAIGNAERGRPTPDFEMSIVARGGAVKWVHVTTLLARSATGHKRVVHLMRDVTALHQLDETRARSIVHAGQATTTPTSEHVDPAAPFPHPHQLTPRELDVLRLLACGLATDAIAATFGIRATRGKVGQGTDDAEQSFMQAYSTDLRERIVRAVATGRPVREAARLFGVSASAVKRYVARQRETGSLACKPIPGCPRRIGKDQEAILRARLEEAPDATVLEHCAWWAEHQGQQLSETTMWRAIRRLGWTHQKSRWLPASARRKPGRRGARQSRRSIPSSSSLSMRAAPTPP